MTVIDVKVASTNASTSDANDGAIEIPGTRFIGRFVSDVFGAVVDESFHPENVSEDDPGWTYFVNEWNRGSRVHRAMEDAGCEASRGEG
jgi:hypothetical protein